MLFYCRCNALWSQMAEAFLKRFFPEKYEAYSAGAKVTPVHTDAVRVMAEIGIDMSEQRSKNIEEFIGTTFDCVALVCGDPPAECPFLHRARESLHCNHCQGCCRFLPFFPSGAEVLHAHFQDPTKLVCPDDDAIDAFRKVRDGIRDWVIETFVKDTPAV